MRRHVYDHFNNMEYLTRKGREDGCVWEVRRTRVDNEVRRAGSSVPQAQQPCCTILKPALRLPHILSTAEDKAQGTARSALPEKEEG